MSKGTFLSEKNEISGRWAIFEDDNISGWLYITTPNENTPVADCWIYNRIPSPTPAELNNYRNSSPPATTEYAAPTAFVTILEEKKIHFKWSLDRNAVAVLIDDVALGYIVVGTNAGFSRNLLKSGPWGNIFDEEKYSNLFGITCKND